MPKRSVGGQASRSCETVARPVGSWVAAGSSLAAIGLATQSGVVTVCAVVLLAPIVYVFARLREHTPDARTTSDFVSAVLGERFGVFAGLLQLVAYLLLAVKFARSLAVLLMGTLGEVIGVDAPLPMAWFAAGSIVAVAAAGAITHLLSTRGIAWVVAILAAAGMLVFFYTAIALVTYIATGSEPDPSIAALAPPRWTYGFVDVVLAVGLVVGFEVVTTMNRNVRSVSRSMGLALALTAGCALIVAVALSPRLFHANPMFTGELHWLTAAYLGDAGTYWLLIGNVALGCAGLLILVFAAVRVVRRLTEQLNLPVPNPAQVAGIVATVAVLLVVDWLWSGTTSSRLGDVGALLLLAVYACATYACARIPRTAPRVAAEAAPILVWIVLAGVVVVPLGQQYLSTEWPLRLGIAAVIVLVAAAIATKARAELPD